jgi:hypothetical protein
VNGTKSNKPKISSAVQRRDGTTASLSNGSFHLLWELDA